VRIDLVTLNLKDEDELQAVTYIQCMCA